MLLKRVFAQGGDTVSIGGAGIKVNGELLPIVRRSARILMVMKCRNIV